jgi:hypothetical protein
MRLLKPLSNLLFAVTLLCAALALSVQGWEPWALAALLAGVAGAFVRWVGPFVLGDVYKGALVLALLSAAAPAWAAEGGGTVLDLSPYMAELVAAIGAVLVAIAGAALRAFHRFLERRWGLELDAETRAYLQDALDRAVDYGVARAAAAAAAAAPSVDLRHEAVRHAAEYALDRVPDALARFGITPAALTRMVEARIEARNPSAVDLAPQPVPAGT